MKGAGWLACASFYPGDVCKTFVGYFVDEVTHNAVTLMSSDDLVCGYYFDMCGAASGEVTYTQATLAQYREHIIATWGARPADQVNNNELDKLYVASNPSMNPATFNILWLSDTMIDPSYTVGAAKTCSDEACCHADIMATENSDKAGSLGSTNCYMNMDGFKKMIDMINSYNTSSFGRVNDIIFGGSAAAYIPNYVTHDEQKVVQ